MKYLIAISVLFLSGCSTAKIGDLEVLNDAGLGEAGEVIRAVESSRVRLGGTPTPTGDASVVNRTVGEAKQIEDKTSIPSIIQSVQYIFQNVDRN